ncbi:MAG TPA: rhomboid family intramembrane serine protease [Cyclobacteriaceae bacterium]|nr:rhomboid family intramembrane serine protease [Cyclobacteriaceae bacterium]
MQEPISITLWIIGITVLVSWYAFSRPRMIQQFAMQPWQVERNREYYRFLSSGFLHANFSHLLWNMLSFYFFGPIVEIYFSFIFGAASPYWFVAFYLLAIIVSDIPSYFKQKHQPAYSSIGASGGVAAIIFASIIFQPLDKICLYGILCFPGFILGTVYLIYSYFKGRNSNDHINHDAHLYGALFGAFFCIVTYPASLTHFFNELMQWKFSF